MKRLLTTGKVRRKADLKDLLDERWLEYESAAFIDDDPIIVTHILQKKEDREIAGFLAATIAWGQRKTIVKNALSLVERMDGCPFDFVTSAEGDDLKMLEGFVHRTFNDTDLLYFIEALRHFYIHKQGLEGVFTEAFSKSSSTAEAIHVFREEFFSLSHPERSTKHVADPLRGSSAKRINMFLRWMIRSNERGVDHGIWKAISPAQLMIPLDTHTGNIARQLGLLNRKQNDWKAVAELTQALRDFDPVDPVKYDFALFGMGMHETG